MSGTAYDERVYLKDVNIYERNFLLNEQNFWNIRRVYDGILYSNLIKDYEDYIKIASKLVNEVTPNKDDLSKINTIMYLIRDGIFSYTNSFIDKSPCVDIIRSKTGINILEGSGCCRHFASFINDIIPESTHLTCVGEVTDPLESEANHVINKINYNGKIYGFDAFNGVLFEFLNKFEMLEIGEDDMRLYYKPYAEVMFYKRSFEEIKNFLDQIRESGKKSITVLELKEIEFSVARSIYCNKGLIQDFKSDTRVQLESINEQIKEIRSR